MEVINNILTGYSTEIELLSTIIITIATIVLAILTAKYVRHTKYMAEQMKSVREPTVYFDFEVPSYSIKLIIGNSGYSPAINIRFDVNKDIKWLKLNKDIIGFSNLPIIKNGISYLAPGRTFKFIAGNIGDSSENSLNNELQMIIHYENESGKKFIKDVSIDLSVYRLTLFETFKDDK